MTNRTVLIGTFAVLVLAFQAVAFPTPAAAQTPLPRLEVTIEAFDDGSATRFRTQNADGEAVIMVPPAPLVLNVTIRFQGTMDHTFTIQSNEASPPSPYLVNVLVPAALGTGNGVSVEFTIVDADRILFGTRNETVETQGDRIRFFCVPHEGAGMVGFIAFGAATQATEDERKGVYLRAYWIGLLGFAGTLLLVAISYFVIKGSSPHYRDHHEHIRRGGP